MYFKIYTSVQNFVFMGKVHRGQIVKQRVYESNKSITQLASDIKYTRAWIYSFFENENLPVDIILKIGKSIHWDFKRDLPDIFPQASEKVEEPQEEYRTSDQTNWKNEAEMWKERYYKLMEDHNRVMQGAVGKLLKDNKK